MQSGQHEPFVSSGVEPSAVDLLVIYALMLCQIFTISPITEIHCCMKSRVI